MTRSILSMIILGCVNTPAFAHTGHLLESGFGHEHLTGLAALIGAFLVSITLWLTRKSDADAEDSSDDYL